jgi:hypothetical protein
VRRGIWLTSMLYTWADHVGDQAKVGIHGILSTGRGYPHSKRSVTACWIFDSFANPMMRAGTTWGPGKTPGKVLHT